MPSRRISPRDRVVISMTCGDIFLGFLAILFPPIAVWIKSGLCSADSLINILLCCLGYIPGLIHAWYIISRNPEQDYDYESIPNTEGGERVTYYYVRHEPGRLDYGTAQQQAPQGHNRPAPPPPKPKNKPTTGGNNSTSNGQGSSRPVTEGPSVGAGGDEAGAPPSYSEVVRGDNKIQSQD